jgi:hypothetical protein
MRIWHQNLIDATGVAITASSQVATLPASNVAHEHRKNIWRTGTSAANESITFDLGSAKAATSVIILDHNFTGSDSAFQLRASTDNFSASNVLIASPALASSAMSATFGSASYRYWRFQFTKSAAGEARDIGRIFLGEYQDTIEQPAFDGYSRKIDDLSTRLYSVSGQKYSNVRPKRRSFRLDFEKCPQAQRDLFAALMDNVGETKSFFVQVDTDAAAPAEVKEILYVNFTKLPDLDNSGYDGAELYWDAKLELEEAL